MKRHLMQQLQAWKVKDNRKPLILKGVRQTGKSYLLESFGRSCFSRCHTINFEMQKDAYALFEQNLDPKRIVSDISFLLKTPIDIDNDVVIFDEIQACPNALTSLKYFCENLPQLALCSAGSLLGLHLNETSYPVGKVDMLYLHPMTFSEFLLGIGDTQASDYFFNINLDSTLSDIVHQQLWQRLKQYFITGGLPEVVALFADQQQDMYAASQAVRQKQRELIEAYYADIAKHAGKVNAMHIDRVWRNVPIQLSQAHDETTSRFRFKGIIPQIRRYSQLANVIDWLASAELIIKTPIVDAVKQPLLSVTKENIFKLFSFDVGILGAMSGLEPEVIQSYDYGSYKGYFAENFVAQQLTASQDQTLFNWQENRSEIEFIIQQGADIVPIEVKSGKITRAKSLEKYINRYQPNKSLILSAQKLATNSERRLLQLPLYLAERALTIE